MMRISRLGNMALALAMLLLMGLATAKNAAAGSLGSELRWWGREIGVPVVANALGNRPLGLREAADRQKALGFAHLSQPRRARPAGPPRAPCAGHAASP